VDLSQYLDLFISEAQDHLQVMNQALLALEKTPDDLGYLDGFFRAAHTLKGMSATLGFQRMATLSHDMENVLDTLRKKERSLTPELADTLFRCLDTLTGLLQGIAAGEGEEQRDIAEMQALLHAVEEIAPPAQPVSAEGAPQVGLEVRIEVAPDCVLKGPRAFLVLKRLEEVASVEGSDPPRAMLRAGEYAEQFRVFLAADAAPEAVQKAANSVAEIVAVTASPLEEASAQPQPARVAAPTPQAPAVPAAEPPVFATPAAPVVRIKVAHLEQLLEAVGNLVINRSHLAQLARKYALPDLKEAVEAHIGAMDRLQEIVLAMRMTPVFQVFNRFPRMVRDLARDQGKRIEFEMEGTEIELDRTILEKITDPLVHLLRNSVDHGIESPEERQRAGKPPAAHVRLQARRERDKAIIEVSDDGGGMSPKKIADRAIERGLVTAQEVSGMEADDILELICRPGFSTRTEVTGVSGRGVGMGVVKQVMDEIGGTLEIESQLGKGSCFRLAFPLTMAILPALLVKVGGETYALALNQVVRTVESWHSQVRQLHHQAVLQSEEGILPLIALSNLLQVPTVGKLDASESEFLTVVVVGRGRQQYGLIVDEILGKEDIVLKPLQGDLQQIEGIGGATIRGEGEIVLVLDANGLIRLLTSGEMRG
jgi:two-component system chemotaxis sensor kinase CheA